MKELRTHYLAHASRGMLILQFMYGLNARCAIVAEAKRNGGL
jgi:hypothetical protein